MSYPEFDAHFTYRNPSGMSVVEEIPPEYFFAEMIESVNGEPVHKGMWLVHCTQNVVHREGSIEFGPSRSSQYSWNEGEDNLALLRLLYDPRYDDYYYMLDPMKYVDHLSKATHRVSGNEDVDIFEDEESSNLTYYIDSIDNSCALCGKKYDDYGCVTHKYTKDRYHIECLKKWQQKLRSILTDYQEQVFVESV